MQLEFDAFEVIYDASSLYLMQLPYCPIKRNIPDNNGIKTCGAQQNDEVITSIRCNI